MITIPSLSEVYDIEDTDVVMVTNNNGNSFKLSGAEVNRRNQVIIADSKTITGSPLKTGRTYRIHFTVTLTASNTTDPLILKYNNTNITVKIAKDGALSNYVAFSVDSTYKYLQAYTTLELFYNGTNFVVIGNPVVLSSNSYTIFANATIHKADVGLGSVANTGDSATPVSGGTTKFTTGGAYTELAKKVDKTSIGAAAGNVPEIGTALGTTDGNIVATNSSGKLKPAGITVANMQAIGTTVANCTTAAGTAAKTASLTGFRLVNPSMIYVKFSNTNSASSPTLNVNSTGAKTIKLNGASVSSTNQIAAGTYLALYDGTYWNLLPYGIASSVASGNMQSVTSNAVAQYLKLQTNAQTYFVNNDTSHTFSNLIPNDGNKYLVQLMVIFIPYYGPLGNGYCSTGDTEAGRFNIQHGYGDWSTGTGFCITSSGLSPNVNWSQAANNSVVKIVAYYSKVI